MTPDDPALLTDYSDDGVDLTLIRWMLSLTPAERLEFLEQHVNEVLAIRELNARRQFGCDNARPSPSASTWDNRSSLMKEWSQRWNEYRRWAEAHSEPDLRSSGQIMGDVDFLYLSLIHI